MQLPPKLAFPFSSRMLPLGQSFTHWPQPTQASLAFILAAFLPDSLGHSPASKAFTGLERGARSFRFT